MKVNGYLLFKALQTKFDNFKFNDFILLTNFIYKNKELKYKNKEFLFRHLHHF